MRNVLGIVVALVAAIALTVTSVGVWGQRTINDADRFGEAVSVALEDPEVSELLAQEAVAALGERVAVVREVDEQLAAEAARVLRLPRFRDAAAELATAAYGVVIDAQGGPVVIDLAALYPAIRTAARDIDPDVARALPRRVELEDLGLDEIEVVGAGVLPDLSPVSSGFREAALFGMVITLLSLLIALGVAANRGVVLAVFGVSLAIANIVVLVLVSPLVGLATDQIADAGVRAAASSISDTLAQPLRTQTIVLAIAGAIIAVAGIFLRARPPAAPTLAPSGETEALPYRRYRG